MSDLRLARQRMVTRHLQARGIQDPRVLEAMRAVPRHRFVEEGLRPTAYGDHALPIGFGQTISQPWTVARMSELAAPGPGDTVLEIGTGSGYHAAVLAHLAGRVFTIERQRELSERARRVIRALGIENVHFKVFDGTYGWSEFAPYDAIVVTAACPEVPAPLLDQLRAGGRLVAPVGEAGSQVLRRLVRSATGSYQAEEHGVVSFVPLTGRYGFPGA